MAVLQSSDDTYNIKYVLGGTEKNVPREFISCIDLNGVKVPRKAATANKENNSNTSNIGGSSKDSGGGAATMAVKAAKQAPAPAAVAVPVTKTAVDTKATATSSSTTTASTTTSSTKRKGLAAPPVNTANKGSCAASTLAVEDKTASGVPTDAKRPKVTGNKVNSSNNNNNKSMKAKAVSDKVTTTAATAKAAKQSVASGSSSSSSHQAVRVQQTAVVKQSVAVAAPKAAAAAAQSVLDIDSERGGVFCSALVSYFEFETDGCARISQILQGVNSRCDDDKQANFTEVEVKQLLKQLDAQGKVLIETYKGNDDLVVHQI
eukprot:21534-Heterococcus_DN1.PRE.2